MTATDRMMDDRMVGPDAAEVITAEQLRADLNARIAGANGVMKWAAKAGLSHTEVSLVRNGHRPASEAVANACGYIVETRFRRIGQGVR